MIKIMGLNIGKDKAKKKPSKKVTKPEVIPFVDPRKDHHDFVKFAEKTKNEIDQWTITLDDLIKTLSYQKFTRLSHTIKSSLYNIMLQHPLNPENVKECFEGFKTITPKQFSERKRELGGEHEEDEPVDPVEVIDPVEEPRPVEDGEPVEIVIEEPRPEPRPIEPVEAVIVPQQFENASWLSFKTWDEVYDMMGVFLGKITKYDERTNRVSTKDVDWTKYSRDLSLVFLPIEESIVPNKRDVISEIGKPIYSSDGNCLWIVQKFVFDGRNIYVISKKSPEEANILNPIDLLRDWPAEAE